MVASGMPAGSAISRAKSADSPMPTRVLTATTAISLGAPEKKPGEKRQPSDAPMATWPAMIIQDGIALSE